MRSHSSVRLKPRRKRLTALGELALLVVRKGRSSAKVFLKECVFAMMDRSRSSGS
jgi:hypothetical protein